MSIEPNRLDVIDPIDELIQAPAQNLGEQREMGFALIKNRMADAYSKKLQSGKTPALVRQSMLAAYQVALEDAFRVFTQIVEGSGRDAEEMIG